LNLKIYDAGDGFDRYCILLMNRPNGNCYEAILAGDTPGRWITGDRLYDELYDKEQGWVSGFGMEITFEQLPKWLQDRLQDISIYL